MSENFDELVSKNRISNSELESCSGEFRTGWKGKRQYVGTEGPREGEEKKAKTVRVILNFGGGGCSRHTVFLREISRSVHFMHKMLLSSRNSYENKREHFYRCC